MKNKLLNAGRNVLFSMIVCYMSLIQAMSNNLIGDAHYMLIKKYIKDDSYQLLRAYLDKNKSIVDLNYCKTNSEPLIFCAIGKSLEFVQLLLHYHIDINIRDSKNRTPLIFAASLNLVRIVQLLLQHKPLINAQDQEGDNALIKILKKPTANINDDTVAIVKLLMESGIHPLMPNVHSETAYNIAVCMKYDEIVQIITNEWNIRIENFLLCAREDETVKAKQLLYFGVDIDRQDDHGMTGLMWAAFHNNIELVKLLINLLANVDMQDNRGWTALYYASFRGHEDIVKILLQANASLGEPISGKKNAVQWAQVAKHDKIVALLSNVKVNKCVVV